MKSLLVQKILFIQSLAKGERNTGEKIFEDVNLQALVNKDGIEVTIKHVYSKTDFFNLLDTVAHNIREDGLNYVLHFEMHGKIKGLSLASEEIVLFEELKPILTELNILTKFNLFLVFGACHAANLINIVSLIEPSPIWGLIAPVESISVVSNLDGFPEFYNELLSSGDGIKAIKILNSYRHKNDAPYYFKTAEQLFNIAFKQYRAITLDEKQARERAVNIRREQLKISRTRALSVEDILEKLVNDLPKEYEQFKLDFFMLDAFPDNKDRLLFDYDPKTDEYIHVL